MSSASRELDRVYREAFDRPRTSLEDDWLTSKGKPNHYRSHHTKSKGLGEAGVRADRADKAAERARVLQVSTGGETDFIFNATHATATEPVPATTDHELEFEKRVGSDAPERAIAVAAPVAAGITFKSLPVDSAEELDDVNARVADQR